MIIWKEEKNGKRYEIEVEEPISSEIIPRLTLCIRDISNSIFDKYQCNLLGIAYNGNGKVSVVSENTDNRYFPSQKRVNGVITLNCSLKELWFLFLEDLRKEISKNGVRKTIRKIVKSLEIPPEYFPIN